MWLGKARKVLRLLGAGALVCVLGLSLGTATAEAHSTASEVPFTWGAPLTLSPEWSGSPKLGADAHGDAIAVWDAGAVGQDVLYATVTPAGGQPEAPVAISDNEEVPFETQIAVDAKGDAVVVWRTLGALVANRVIRSAFKPAGREWQAPVTLSEVQTERLEEPERISARPAVAIDSRGDAIAVWSHFNGKTNVVQAATRPARGAWGEPVDLSGENESAEEPRVAMNAKGSAVVAWEASAQSRYVSNVIQSASKTAGGSWQAPVELSDEIPETASETPRVALDNHGDAVVAWMGAEHATGGYAHVMKAAYRKGAADWEAPIGISIVNASHWAREPNVVMTSKGEPVVLWNESNGDGKSEIDVATKYRGYRAWRPPVTISEPGQVYEPVLSIDKANEIIAAWERSASPGSVIQSSLRAIAGGSGSWATPIRVSEAGSRADAPQVALASAGRAIAAWQNTEGPYLVQEALSVPGEP